MNYLLEKNFYTWENTLLWGSSFEHLRRAQTGNLAHRIVHFLIGLAEFSPLIGQIVSIFEKIIVAVHLRFQPPPPLPPEEPLTIVVEPIQPRNASPKIDEKDAPARTNPIFDYTLFHSLDNQRIQEETEQNKDRTYVNLTKMGIRAGIISVIRNISLGLILVGVSGQIFKAENATSNLDSLNFMEMVVAGPIVEELILRSFFQGQVFSGLQSIAKKIAPKSIENTRVFKWLNSPSARIFAGNSLFALCHLGNAGGYLSTAKAVVQVALIFLNPAEAILYETTGTVFTGMIAHSTNNLLPYLLRKWAAK